MKVNRRGLGGLLAGAVSALQVNKMGDVKFNVPVSTPGMSVNEAPIPMSPEEEFKHLLAQLNAQPNYEQRSRHSESQIFDPDVKALKSCSPSGRDLINRRRTAAYFHEQHKTWIQSRLNDLLKRNPLLQILT